MPAAAPTTTALDTERLTATTLENLNAAAGLLTAGGVLMARRRA